MPCLAIEWILRQRGCHKVLRPPEVALCEVNHSLLKVRLHVRDSGGFTPRLTGGKRVVALGEPFARIAAGFIGVEIRAAFGVVEK